VSIIDSRTQLALVHLWHLGHFVRCNGAENAYTVTVMDCTSKHFFFSAPSRDVAIEAAARHFGWNG
jgi:hypothetical protein